MPQLIRTYSPIDGSIVFECQGADTREIAEALSRAVTAQASWQGVPLRTRIEICRRFAVALSKRRDELGLEITLQMGRPIRYSPNEIVGAAGRAVTMCDLAESALEDIHLGPKEGFSRYIRRTPLGIVLAIAPWNYPYLTAINVVIPAILAGNAILLKHSPQTAQCSERLFEAFEDAGLPRGVFQYLHLSDEDTEALAKAPEVHFVAFTGSVATGLKVQQAIAGKVCGVGLELGGKDAAYVRADANLPFAIENVVDGAFFNSGQSCCAVERIYVHADVYDAFVEGAVNLTHDYILGDPRSPETTLGPMVRASAAEFVRGQVAEALSKGAHGLIDQTAFKDFGPSSPYLPPQILVDVDHSMRVMLEESFGPVVGIMKVQSDEEAISLINDSPFGLTASIWSEDLDASTAIGDLLEVGTVFMNRCDYLDPELAWVGVKNSGRGCTLSRVGFEQLTRPKSYHLRLHGS